MTTEEIRNQFEKESGQNWWTAPNWYDPICNSIKVFASFEYQEWLEKKLLSLQYDQNNTLPGSNHKISCDS